MKADLRSEGLTKAEVRRLKEDVSRQMYDETHR